MNDARLDPGLEAIVDTYLRELEASLRRVPAQRRDQLVSEIRDHIAELRDERPVYDRSDMEALLNRVGLPEDIAAAALEGDDDKEVPVSPEPPAGHRHRGTIALIVGVLALFFGLGPILALTFGLWGYLFGHPTPAHVVSGRSAPPAAVARVTEPVVTGMSVAQASATLQATGLEVAPVSGPAGDVVTAESPAAGSMVAPHSAVVLTVSSSP